MVRIRVEGEKAAIEAVNTASKEFIDEMEGNVAILVSDIHGKASSRVPVDLGFLKNSLYQESEGLNGEVGARVNYAPYIEFGTGGKADIPQELKDYASEFKGLSQKHTGIPARPFLFNSAFEETKSLIDKLRKIGVVEGG